SPVRGRGGGGVASFFASPIVAAPLVRDFSPPRGESGPAMGAGQDPLVAQLVKILANGLWRDPVARGKFLDGHPPQLARQRDDLLMPEIDCHWRCSRGVFGA